MVKDYHMHPKIIQEPERFELFVQQALARGVEEICITDHMPLSISNAADRIPKGKVKEYCRKAKELTERYEDIISIKTGIEIDYHPDFVHEIESVLADGDFDYILGSSHMHLFRKNAFDGRYRMNDFAQLALENTLSAVKSGYFHTIAHMDMYRWIFFENKTFPLQDDGYDVMKHMDVVDEILRCMKDNHMYLEINPHFAEGQGKIEFTYPQTTIVERALDYGLQFRYGSDAHVPKSVGVMLDELREHPVYGRTIRNWESD